MFDKNDTIYALHLEFSYGDHADPT